MTKLTEIMLLQQPEQPALTAKYRGDINSFSGLIAEGFEKIGTYLKELGEEPTDIPCVEYPAFEEMTKENIELIICFYTAKPLRGKGEIESVIIPARKIAVCLHKGTYDEMAELYLEMLEWIKSKGYESNGASIEHYYTGPDVPITEHITRIVMPLK